MILPMSHCHIVDDAASMQNFYHFGCTANLNYFSKLLASQLDEFKLQSSLLSTIDSQFIRASIATNRFERRVRLQLVVV